MMLHIQYVQVKKINYFIFQIQLQIQINKLKQMLEVNKYHFLLLKMLRKIRVFVMN